MFRVVRYLPVARHGRGHGTDLRAGVGQALVERRQQAQAVLADEPVRLDARPVLVEAQVGFEPRHAHVDEGPAQLVVGDGLSEAGLVPHAVSYTHLDVYKRQPLATVGGLPATRTLSVASSPSSTISPSMDSSLPVA